MSTVKIHPTAVISPKAYLDSSVSVDAYSIIGEHVEIGANTSIASHVVITGHTSIGKENRIFQFNSIGEAPQDKKYQGEPTRLQIGDNNTIREFCTLNSGTIQDDGITKIGNDNWIMAYVHIAHDCHIGDHTIFANNTQLAGHVHVGDWAIFGGFSGVHQFVRVGAHSMTAINSILLQDLPPYVLAAGNPASPHGINSEGLRRRGYTPEAILAIKQAYKVLYRNGLKLEEAIQQIKNSSQPACALLLEFISAQGRGIIR